MNALCVLNVHFYHLRLTFYFRKDNYRYVQCFLQIYFSAAAVKISEL